MSSQGRPAATSTAALTTALTAALTALLLAFSVVGALPAAAHAQLLSSNPADDAVLAAAPERVEFVFNEDINPSFAQVVIDADGARNQAADEVTVDGAKVSAAIPAEVTQGEVTTRYRVVSADGHPIAGEITFTVEAGNTSPTTSSTAAPGTTTPNAAVPTAAPTTGAPTTAVPNADEPADIEAAPSSADAPNVVPYMLMGLAAVLMVAFGVYLLRTERRRR